MTANTPIVAAFIGDHYTKKAEAAIAHEHAKRPKVTFLESFAVYLGYSIPLYSEFHDFAHMPVLGRLSQAVAAASLPKLK